LEVCRRADRFDYPLSSRFDENDAILVFDNVFIPWENVLVHRDVNKFKKSFPRFGFIAAFQFHSRTRLAVKLDFLVGLLVKAVRVTGVDEFRGTQVARRPLRQSG
jgi:4-hydroxyphenylacetate 3-monooxygenase